MSITPLLSGFEGLLYLTTTPIEVLFSLKLNSLSIKSLQKDVPEIREKVDNPNFFSQSYVRKGQGAGGVTSYRR